MNLPINAQKYTPRGRRICSLFSSYPPFHQVSYKIASKHGYVSHIHPIHAILGEIDTIIDTNYVRRDKVISYLDSNKDYFEECKKLRNKLKKTTQELNELKRIMKLLRLRSDSNLGR
jgi:hypothetical protein